MKVASTLLFLAVGLCAHQGLCFTDPFHAHCGKPCVHVATRCAPISVCQPHPGCSHGNPLFMGAPEVPQSTSHQASAQHVTYPSSYHPCMPSYCVQSVIVGGKSEQEEKKENHTQQKDPETHGEDSDEDDDEYSEDSDEDSDELVSTGRSRSSSRISQGRRDSPRSSMRAHIDDLIEAQHSLRRENLNRDSTRFVVTSNRDVLRRSRTSGDRLVLSRSRHGDCGDEGLEFRLISRGDRLYRCREV